MRKIFTIALKDLRLIFRDRAALIMMLLAPYLLTLGLGFVTGAFEENNDNGGLRDIPVQIVNLDAGELGQNLIDVFTSAELQPLFLVETTADIDAARALVDEDALAAVIVIPSGFTAAMIPDASSGTIGPAAPVELYRSPARPVSASVIDAVVSQFINQVDANATLVTVSIEQMIASGLIDVTQIGSELAQLGLLPNDSAANAAPELIVVQQTTGAAQEQVEFDVLTLLVPGMALFFLMYTVTLGGRSILMEALDGTLARMRTTPTTATQILGGKVVGVILTGVAQVAILVVGSTLLYDIAWGDGVAVAVLIVSAAIAASGWGILFASTAKTPDQITGIGTAVMLVFGAVSGTFTQIDNPLLRAIGRITPNQWAIDGFTALGLGDSLPDILPNVAALWLMALLLFAISATLFRRNLA